MGGLQVSRRALLLGSATLAIPSCRARRRQVPPEPAAAPAESYGDHLEFVGGLFGLPGGRFDRLNRDFLEPHPTRECEMLYLHSDGCKDAGPINAWAVFVSCAGGRAAAILREYQGPWYVAEFSHPLPYTLLDLLRSCWVSMLQQARPRRAERLSEFAAGGFHHFSHDSMSGGTDPVPEGSPCGRLVALGNALKLFATNGRSERVVQDLDRAVNVVLNAVQRVEKNRGAGAARCP